jgi:hypothetical protein
MFLQCKPCVYVYSSSTVHIILILTNLKQWIFGNVKALLVDGGHRSLYYTEFNKSF